jgi:hypothetical protein
MMWVHVAPLTARIFVIILSEAAEKDKTMSDDGTNPMHKFGYGRGDDAAPAASKPKMTQAYSFVNPQKIVNVGASTTMEPTQPMEAVEILTVKEIMHRLVERNLQAWKALPEPIRDRMLDHPKDFQLVPNDTRKEGDYDYNIVYNGTVWRYHNTAVVWVIHKILR